MGLRPYLEAAYFVAGVILAAGLIAAFVQIVLLKRDIRTRNERAAKEKAIEAASRYLVDYVRLETVRFSKQLDQKLQSYTGPIGDFSRSSVQYSEKTAQRALLPNGLETLNELEAISAYFTSGVADEAMGFTIIGRTFCSTIEHNYDIISTLRGDEGPFYYENIVLLYRLWRPRLTRSELLSAKDLLEQKIGAIKDADPIRPIGT
jgi:hypothetical protein